MLLPFILRVINRKGFQGKGFAKDGKIGKTIITFGLLIDKDNQPDGYKVLCEQY